MHVRKIEDRKPKPDIANNANCMPRARRVGDRGWAKTSSASSPDVAKTAATGALQILRRHGGIRQRKSPPLPYSVVELTLRLRERGRGEGQPSRPITGSI